jgi:hypothetical protein|nr:MAG TPA: Head decoration protein, Viral protein.95A [Caudoviricetes sp.]
MKSTEINIGGTVEILAADDFIAIPIAVTETSLVKAGTPLTLAGKKATVTEGSSGAPSTTDAAGILLYDVYPEDNPNAALVVQGVIDQKKAEAHSGVTLDAVALKTAVPGIVLRNNIGVNT